MLGAIVGDVVGAAHARHKILDFELITPSSGWTENTIFLLGTAACLLYGGEYVDCYQRWFQWYPKVKGGYGKSFSDWASAASLRPYYSCRNDGAMRAIPVAYAFDNLKDVMAEAERSAVVTHNHPEGIKGAQAAAAAVFLAKAGATKAAMTDLLTTVFAYDLQTSYEALQIDYRFSELTQDTVAAAIIAFLSSTDFDDAVRKAVGLGGDASTLAAIAGGIAEAFYPKIKPGLRQSVWNLLDESQQDLITEFKTEFMTEKRAIAA